MIMLDDQENYGNIEEIELITWCKQMIHFDDKPFWGRCIDQKKTHTASTINKSGMTKIIHHRMQHQPLPNRMPNNNKLDRIIHSRIN